VFSVGRLDKPTTGLLLLTNDGELADFLSHPKNNKKKIYQVTLDRTVNEDHLQNLYDGVELEDGIAKADLVTYCTPGDKREVGIEIHSGKNRLVRRMFEHLGYKVKKLDRVYYAGLTKKNLPRGKWRYLNDKEIVMLKRGSYS
jgi:23S rRNA pseudouridine2605 synthase